MALVAAANAGNSRGAGTVCPSMFKAPRDCANVSSYRIKGEQEWRGKRDERDPYQQEHDDLFNAIRKDIPYNETAAYGAYSTMTAILGRMATYSGKEIKWDDAINSQIDTMPKVLGWDADPPTKPDASGRYPVAVPGVTITV